jgi:Tol biopolymer transport system component
LTIPASNAMRSLSALCLITLWAASAAFTQPAIVKVHRIPPASARGWAMPQWSPDGKDIFFTASDFNGIWSYTVSSGVVRQVTADKQSGYGFVIAPDGSEIVYRRTLTDSRARQRVQETVAKSLTGKGSRTLAKGSDLQPPTMESLRPALLRAGGTYLLGTEKNKIAVMMEGTKRLLAPLGENGRYIWPALSPDGTRLVAYEMERGTFVCDSDGENPVSLGRKDAAVWTRDGRWLIYMADTDDGKRVTGSELALVSPDGKMSATLTATPGQTEMYPRCSPTEDKIVCSTLEGDILILTYGAGGR